MYLLSNNNNNISPNLTASTSKGARSQGLQIPYVGASGLIHLSDGGVVSYLVMAREFRMIVSP